MTSSLRMCPLLPWWNDPCTVRSAGLLYLESSNPSLALARQEGKR
jgi:hypothetical protein